VVRPLQEDEAGLHSRRQQAEGRGACR